MQFAIGCGILEENQHFQKQHIRKGSSMKPPPDIIAEPARRLLNQVAAWSLTLSRWHERLASYFARPEPRQHALLYLRAILSEIPRKNGWQIAEHARQSHPYGMQRLL